MRGAPSQLTLKNHDFFKDLLPLSSKIYMFGTFEQRSSISFHSGPIVTKMNKLLIEPGAQLVLVTNF